MSRFLGTHRSNILIVVVSVVHTECACRRTSISPALPQTRADSGNLRWSRFVLLWNHFAHDCVGRKGYAEIVEAGRRSFQGSFFGLNHRIGHFRPLRMTV